MDAEAGTTAKKGAKVVGTGFNMEVHSFPLDGRLVLFPADSEARADELAGATAPPPAPNRNGNQRRR
jgi:hypothetical protein